MKSALFFLLIFLFVTNTAANIELLKFGSQQEIDAIAENTAIGNRMGYIRINDTVTNLSDNYNVTVTPNTNFNILDSTHDDDGKRRLYLISTSDLDYEVDPSSYDITITATPKAAGSPLTFAHTINLLPENDNEATCKSLNGLPIKENTTLAINIATMLLDTNGVLWKDFSQYKVSDADIPADSNFWWIDSIIRPQHGTLTWSKMGTFQYDFPAQGNEAVADTFYYTLFDSAAYEKTTNQQQFMFSVKFKNISDEPPIAGDDTLIVDEGQNQTTLINGITSVLANDTDLDNSLDYDGDGIIDTLDYHTVSLKDSTIHGTLTLNSDGTFSYKHDGSTNYSDQFTYIIDDGTYTDIATVLIIVNPINNNPPIITADTLLVSEGGTATALKSGITSLLALATDADLPHDTLLVTPVTNVATTCGTITIAADGSFTYTHNGSEIFSDAIQFTITDEIGHVTTGTIPIIVTPVSDIAPIAVSDAISVVEGAVATTLVSGTTSVLANDTDVENDISGLEVTLLPVHGTLTIDKVTGTFSYAHNGSETVADSFFYYATDGTNSSAPVKVSITITPNLTVTAPNSATLYNSGCLLTVTGTTGIIGSQISVICPLSGSSGSIVTTATGWILDVQPLRTYEGPDTLIVVSSMAGTIADTVLVPVQFGRAANPFGYTVISVNDPVQFTDSSSTLFAPTATYLWDFGDGTTSTLKDPSHLYALPGVYNVTEVVTYYTGCSDTLRASISVFNNISPTTENFFLDMNADGMMDRISLSFPAAITRESLTGISFHFTWLSANKTVVTLSPSLDQWVFPAVSSQTIYFDVPQGSTADNVTSIGSGYGTGQLVSGSRVEAITMKDGMAPVITYARIPSALPNNIILTYSETVTQPSVSPQQFDLLEDRTGLPYGATLTQLNATSLDRIYAISALTNAFRIKADDRISINPSAFISDIAGNIQSNPLNDKVPVLVPRMTLTCKIHGFSPVDPAVQSLTFVSENLVQAPPAVLSTGTAFDIYLNYPIENHNIGIKFVLIDAVGNVVCDIEKVGIFENELFVSSDQSNAQLIRVLWTGRNLQKRLVGGGAYMVIATVIDLTTGASAEGRTMIKVLQ